MTAPDETVVTMGVAETDPVYALARDAAAGTITSPSLGILARYDEELPAMVSTALGTDEWDDCVAHFGDQSNRDHAVFVGPMRAREDGADEPGMFVARRTPFGTEVSAAVAGRLVDLGESIFGYPCELHGRVVEFHDLQVASGPLTRAEDAPIAMFTPYYLGGWRDRDRQSGRRRSLMFSNVVRARFHAVAAVVSERGVTVGDAPPRLLTASREQFDRAVGGWLTLHEVMHGSGPAPFFADWTGKHACAEYGAVEEARVDMTAYLAADLIGPSVEPALLRELIVLERLLRSGRRAMSRVGQRPAAADVDADHGMVWIRALCEADAVRVHGAGVDIDPDSTLAAVTSVAAGIYESEQQAAESDEAREHLAHAGARFHARYLADDPRKLFPAAERMDRLGAGLPVSVGLRDLGDVPGR